MKLVKKTAALILSVCLIFSLAACTQNEKQQGGTPKIRIACDKDCSITAAKLGVDHKNEYEITNGTESETEKAFSNGEADIAVCSLAAALRLCSGGSGARIACAGAQKKLFVMARDADKISDLSDLEGKTITVSSSGDSKSIVNYILVQNGVRNFNLVSPESEGEGAVVNKLNSEGGIGILSEPSASAFEEKNSDYYAAVDLQEKWKAICGTENTAVTCCAVVSKKLMDENFAAVRAFELQYQVSINYLFSAGSTNAGIDLAGGGSFSTAEKATSALQRMGLKYISGDDMKFAVAATVEALADGGVYGGVKVPGENIFC